MVKKRKPGEVLTPGQEVQDDDEPTTTPSEVDLSTVAPINGRIGQCVRTKKNGERCRKQAIKGATVCRFHGGAAPQVKQAAQVRLAMAAVPLVKELLKIAASEEDASIRLRAVNSALDRIGIGAKAELEVTHELKPFEQIMEDLVFGNIRRGPSPEAVDPADAAELARYNATEGDRDVIDVEVVEDPSEERPTGARPTQSGGPMETFSWDEIYGGPGPRRRRSGRNVRRD